MGKKAVKAYKSSRFLNSADARTLRILSEYLEPEARFEKLNIKDTIVFFGSSRVTNGKTAKKRYELWERRYKESPTKEHKNELRLAKIRLRMSRYYDDARVLARLITEWSYSIKNSHHRFIICSGGGPGVMEAANHGAQDVVNGKSIGLNISIPMEQDPNNYVSPELNFEFHYFFMRKFWFVYPAKALVIFPGGFGTMDELWEVLTLLQTNKIQKKMYIVLYGEEYWKKVINFKYMVDNLVIDDDDLELFHFSNSPQEAFEYLRDKLTETFL
jgi:uncharacterized protein (TIGR00730 family)